MRKEKKYMYNVLSLILCGWSSENVEIPFSIVRIQGSHLDEIRNNKSDQIGGHGHRFFKLIPKEIFHSLTK